MYTHAYVCIRTHIHTHKPIHIHIHIHTKELIWIGKDLENITIAHLIS